MSKNGLSKSISKIADKLPYIGFLSAFLVIKALSIDGRVVKMYDGTMDSLMSIVEEQLLMMTKDYEPDDDDDEDDDDDTSRGKLIGVEEDEDDEEEVRPKKKLSSSKSSGKKLFKSPQNSTKPRAKTLLKSNK